MASFRHLPPQDFFNNDSIAYIEAERSKKNNDDGLKVIPQKVYNISKIRKSFSKNVNIKIDFTLNNSAIVNELYNISEEYPGSCGLILHIMNSNGKFEKIKSSNMLISNDQSCIDALRNKLGANNVWLS